MTRALFGPAAWRGVRSALASGRPLLVALDLDGTLAPIVARPGLARVAAATRRALRRAVLARSVRIAIVSARPARDLRRLLPVRGLVRVGQYGLEGPVAPPRSERERVRRACARLARALGPLTRGVPGALIEPKGFTVAVHWRSVRGQEARRRLFASLRTVAPRARQEGFLPTPGAEVLDFVPRGRDKGAVLRALRARLRPAVVAYFGDSGGDEPGFRVLRARDVPVRVGPGPTGARYRVAGIAGVTRFLDAVSALRAGPA